MTEFDFRDSGFINYDAAANIERELREQYAVQEAEGKAYERPKDLDTIFRGQAAKLAGQGVESIYDLMPTTYERDGRVITNLLNKRTGDVLREARVTEGWQEDPTAITFKKTRNAEGEVVNMPIELKDRNGYQQWGSDTSVSDMARYGINFVDGTPVFTPVYKDTTNFTTSDAVKVAAAIVAAYYGGSYLLGGETAAAGATTAGAGAAGTGAAGTGTTLATSTAVPGSLQATLPSLGVQTAATTAASTAVPGTFSAALPGLLAPAAAGAPIYFAEAVPAEQLAYPAREVAANYTPVPGSFQEALPGLGVETAASAAPFTAAPGSFQAAVPSLLGAGGAAGLSLVDAARGVDALKDLTFKPPQPGQQQQPIRRPQSQFSLPAPQQTVVGLLPLAERYRRSLI